MRVLLVEDELTAAQSISLILRADGLLVDSTDHGESLLELVRHYTYDVVVLNLMLADINGYEVVRQLRLARMDVPVLVLSAAGQSELRVRLFSAGADDVITRPFDTPELVARMHAIVRRYCGFSDASLTAGPLTIHQDRRKVSIDGDEVKLTGKEYAILELLVLRRGSVLTTDALLNHLYGGVEEPEAKIIDVLVCKLRKKLELFGADNLIVRVWGRGYVLREFGMDAWSSYEASEEEFVDDGYRPLFSPSRALSVLLGQVEDGKGVRSVEGVTASLIVTPRRIA